MTWLLTHLTLTGAGLVTLAALIAIQIQSARRLSGELRRAAELAGRLDRLTAALNLLTDTTEGGLSALTAEIERLSRRTVVAAKDGRKAAARRDEVSQAALDAALS